jgi:hypothetical protein
MHIAAHFNQKSEYESPLLKLLKILSVKYPEHKFTFFVETLLEDLPKNCTQVTLSPKPKNNFLLVFWYKFKVHSYLKIRHRMVFISEFGLVCNQSPIPQYLFFKEEDFWEDSNPVFKSGFTAALARANKIFTTQTFLAESLIEKHKIPYEKIETIFQGLNGKIKEYSLATIEEIKMAYSNGFDYFLFAVSNTSKEYLIHILKAFSQLKKMQKTSMKLILLLDDVVEENLIPDFKNYKYKDEVYIIIQTVNNRRNIVSASSALFYFSTYTENSIAFVAVQQAIPIITLDNKINKSLLDNAALYTTASDKAIGEKMQLLYKDESIKDKLKEASIALLQKHDITEAAEQLYKAIYVK